MKRVMIVLFTVLAAVAFFLTGCDLTTVPSAQPVSGVVQPAPSAAEASGSAGTEVALFRPEGSTIPGELTAQIESLPAYSGKPYVKINGGEARFSADEITDKAFEYYSPLDRYGRCGTAAACVGRELMPTQKRGNISEIKPSGWQTVRYDFVDGGSLYNRSHLIGYQLTAENANRRNLITGTRYFNAQGMQPFENMVGDYVKETGNHVMYTVTPLYRGKELVARGVLMQAYSVEDDGAGINYLVYCYNVQPGVTIDYATGRSEAAPETQAPAVQGGYVLNTKSKKFHLPDCEGVANIKNAETYSGSRASLIEQGYVPCGSCRP